MPDQVCCPRLAPLFYGPSGHAESHKNHKNHIHWINDCWRQKKNNDKQEQFIQSVNEQLNNWAVSV